MGVPASVIFEGKFSSNSMSQLQLLNTTVTAMALSVNKVLTACYHAVYDDAIEGDELVLLTAPLAATTEVQELFTAGIIDIVKTTLERNCNAKPTFHASRRIPRSPPRCTRWAARPSRSRARSSAAARRTRTARMPT